MLQAFIFILGGGLRGKGGYRKRKEDKSENGIKILSTDKVNFFKFCGVLVLVSNFGAGNILALYLLHRGGLVYKLENIKRMPNFIFRL